MKTLFLAFVLMLSMSILSSQEKKSKMISIPITQDTLMARVDMMRNIDQRIDQIVRDDNTLIGQLQAQKAILEGIAQDSIRVKK